MRRERSRNEELGHNQGIIKTRDKTGEGEIRREETQAIKSL